MIQNSHAYIYLLQSGEYINTNIYKIGKTVQKSDDTRVLNRIKSYSQGTIIYNLYHIHNVNNINLVENEIIHNFRTKYRLVTGREWFEGNIIQMKLDIDQIVNKYNGMPPEYSQVIEGLSSDNNNDDLLININEVPVGENNNDRRKNMKMLLLFILLIIGIVIIASSL
jgi:hypothetical protein